MPIQIDEAGQARQTTLIQDLVALTRHSLTRRRGMYIFGGGFAFGGVYLGWDWLVALGFAPFLLAVLPCVAMCAAGVCMNSKVGESRSSPSDDPSKAGAIFPAPKPPDAPGSQTVRGLEKQ